MKKLTTEQISEKRLKSGDESSGERLPVTVLLDNVRSLYNVGSIFRTSDGVFIRSMVLSGYTPVPPRKEIEKTALGATKSIPWSHANDPVSAIRNFKKQGYKIFCLEQTDASIPYNGVQYNDFPLCLIVGNEVGGVSSKLIQECDGAIAIPMFGTKHSLNVAVAYGIAIFQLSLVYRSHDSH